MGGTEIQNMSSLELSEEKREIFKKFKEAVSEIPHPEIEDDNFLIKWLIARNFNLNKAIEMFKKHIKFVVTYELHKIDENYVPAKATQYFFTANLGYDKGGAIVRILNVGMSDIRALSLSVNKSDAVRHAAFIILSDTAKQKRDRQNQSMTEKQVAIIDLEGLTWRSVMHRSVIERAYFLFRNYEANYPENLKVCYVVHAPSFFNFIFNWVKTILPESIISKVKVLNPEEIPQILSETMDLSIVPAYLGGFRRDPDGNPRCLSLYPIPPGTPFPESLMPQQQFDVLNNDPEAKKVVVESKAFHTVDVEITEEHSTILWDFQTVNYDIRFGVNYKESQDSEAVPIVKLHRVDSHLIPESGRTFCQNTGIYELVFDNTYSWMTRKELIYKVTIHPLDREITIHNL